MARTPKIVEDRREQIIDAAMRVFAEKGFDKATNKDIANEAGITAGLIYHYFKSKEDLLRAILEEHSPLRLLQMMPENFLEMEVESVLHFLAQQLLNIAEDEHYLRLARVYLVEAIHHPESISFSLAGMQEVFDFLVSYLAAKMESGTLRRTDPGMVVQVFGGSLMAFVIRRQIMRDPISLQYSHEQIVESVITIILEGLHPR
jgi:AcrR family transcriptional regulator